MDIQFKPVSEEKPVTEATAEYYQESFNRSPTKNIRITYLTDTE